MHEATRSLLRRPAIRLSLAATAAAVAVGLGIPGGAAPGDAADRYVAGGPLVERSAVAADRADAVRGLARTFGARLGLSAAAATRVERVSDRFAGTVYDEVTGTDAAGRALHLQRFDDRGRLVAAVTFGWQSAGGKALADAPAASRRAVRLAADLGLAAAGSPDARRLADEDGWTVAWPRVVDGIPVPGDGVRIDLWPDGRVHAIVSNERPLAARPATLLDQAAARARAGTTLASLFGDRAGEVKVAQLALGWVPPNDAFDPTAPDAPDTTLRLAWIVEVRTTGNLAEGLRAVRMYLDAGSGALIGGDVLR